MFAARNVADATDPVYIAKLAADIEHHRALYYAGTPEVRDLSYDWLEDKLRQLAPNHPTLAKVGTPSPTA
jgi:DNA ligase (NAD+)